ncbi:acylphosphatase [Candidatus Methanoperedens nitroreducens]|uniref:acylphosphatase n=1 Tax=Candidatus Methanoperedens nitratireducens TaxID=1392998 RepID=A0A062V5Y7_9EURY|nr:acylphosphatase [Candidatus Methanoperedens nitroreducens]KCZ72742.1 acylphosphatase [Candidatus Methanoperedens nitroreducens]MDJ1423325.1 acylphosphatase [Candidatus Methanoperedens sp.]
MKHVHALISGEVQGVGYREEVKRLAFDLNICGWVMNLEDGRVEITAEGESKSIEEFLDKINIKKYPIFVEEVKVDEETYTGGFRSFRIIRDKDLQKELLSAILRGTVEIHEVKEVLLSVKQDTSAMLEKQDSMLEKQDSMLEKQDSMLEKQDLMIEKQDSLIKVTEKGFNDMKTGFREIKEEIHLVRDDFREMFMHEIRELRSEITEIKATLTRMQEAG